MAFLWDKSIFLKNKAHPPLNSIYFHFDFIESQTPNAKMNQLFYQSTRKRNENKNSLWWSYLLRKSFRHAPESAVRQKTAVPDGKCTICIRRLPTERRKHLTANWVILERISFHHLQKQIEKTQFVHSRCWHFCIKQ